MDRLTSWIPSIPSLFSPQFSNSGPNYRGTLSRRPSRAALHPVHSGRQLDPSASLAIDKGLINKPGDNNCFLNAAVQVLWHINVFRRSFRQFEGHTCVGETCIFCALKVLFTQYQHSSQAALPPDILRNAMAECYEDQQRFQLGLMDDAAECFEKILEQIHYHLTGTVDLDVCSVAWCIPHQKFSLTTVEQTICECGNMSEPLTFVEFVHYVSTSVLVSEAESCKSESQTSPVSFDTCLHEASAINEARLCQHYPKCRKLVKFRRTLLNDPDVVCIGLIWDSDSPPVSYIMNVIETIDLKIHPRNIFDRVMSTDVRNAEYHLAAMITYYGRHYSTFCFHSHKQEWIYFDDARVRKVGSSWSNVMESCKKAHYQPLLLVYENPNNKVVDVTEAPKSVNIVSPEARTPSTGSTIPPPLDQHQSSSEATPTTVTPMPTTAKGGTSSTISSTSTSVTDISSSSSTESATLVSNQQPDLQTSTQTKGSSLEARGLSTQAKGPSNTGESNVQKLISKFGQSGDGSSARDRPTSQQHATKTSDKGQQAVSSNMERDLIEFSLTPAAAINQKPQQSQVHASATSDRIINSTSSSTSTAGSAKGSGGDLINLGPNSQQQLDLDNLYIHNQGNSTGASPSLYPKLEQLNTKATTGRDHTTPFTDKCPTPPTRGRSLESSSGRSPTPPRQNPVPSHNPNPPSTTQSTPSSQLQSMLAGLPVEVQHSIVTVYCSICKARQYTDDDCTVAKLLLEHAHSQIESVLKHKSVISNSQLMPILIRRKYEIRAQATTLKQSHTQPSKDSVIEWLLHGTNPRATPSVV